MHEIKQKTFSARSPDRVFPAYRTLSKQECKSLLERMNQQLSLPQSASGLEANIAIRDATTTELLPNVEDLESVDWVGELRKRGIEPLTRIYLDWDQFVNVDTMLLTDFGEDFDNIWYPSSDDIAMFDDGLGWVVTIFHWGAVQLVRLPL